MANKGMTLKINPEQVMATNIRRTKGGYNSASMAVKLGDNEYMSINYEWEGDNVTDVAMDFMGFMNANKEIIEEAIASHASSYEEYSAKKKMPMKKKDMPMDEDEEYMMDEKNPKDEKEMKKKKKSKK